MTGHNFIKVDDVKVLIPNFILNNLFTLFNSLSTPLFVAVFFFLIHIKVYFLEVSIVKVLKVFKFELNLSFGYGIFFKLFIRRLFRLKSIQVV